MTAYRGGRVSTAAAREGEWVAVHGCGGVGLVGDDDRGRAGARVVAVDIDAG